MPEWMTWILENGDRVGAVSVLLAVAGVLGWVVRYLYREQRECEKSRLETQTVVGELKGDVRAVAARLEVTEEHRKEHIDSLRELHRSILETVAKDNRR